MEILAKAIQNGTQPREHFLTTSFSIPPARIIGKFAKVKNTIERVATQLRSSTHMDDYGVNRDLRSSAEDSAADF